MGQGTRIRFNIQRGYLTKLQQKHKKYSISKNNG